MENRISSGQRLFEVIDVSCLLLISERRADGRTVEILSRISNTISNKKFKVILKYKRLKRQGAWIGVSKIRKNEKHPIMINC